VEEAPAQNPGPYYGAKNKHSRDEGVHNNWTPVIVGNDNIVILSNQ